MKLGWEEDSGQKKNLSFYKQIQTFQILKQGISFGEGFAHRGQLHVSLIQLVITNLHIW